MVTAKMQHRQLRRRVPVVIKRGEEPRDLAHLLADLERRQAPEPEEDEEGASQPKGAEAEEGEEGASQPKGAEAEEDEEGASQPKGAEAEEDEEGASQPGGEGSESSDSSGDSSSSSSSSSGSEKSKAPSEAPKSSSPPAAGLPAPTTLPVIPPPPAQNAVNGTVPNRGAIIVPVPAGINTPTTLLTSTTRAATSPSSAATTTPTTAPLLTMTTPTTAPLLTTTTSTTAPLLTTTSPSPSSATSPTLSLSSTLIPSSSPPALSLPLPVPSSSPDLVSSGVVGSSPPSATPEPTPTGATLNAGGTVSAVSGSGDAPGIIAGSIAGVACVTGLSIYLYRRYKKTGEADGQPKLDEKPVGPGASVDSFSSANIIITPPTDASSLGSRGFPTDQQQLERMTALNDKQYAAYRNLVGEER
uniref:Uncharacterized protein n=1 Tax=Pyricularia oryzae (strain P131) TaxID=1143193 RepID=L7JMH3_PYRO1